MNYGRSTKSYKTLILLSEFISTQTKFKLFQDKLENVSVLVLVCCGAGAVGSSGFGRHSGRGTSVIRLCPVGWKNFFCRMEKFFLPTGKNFPDNLKKFSFRQDTNECPTFLFLNAFQSQKSRQPERHNRLTKTKLFIFQA